MTIFEYGFLALVFVLVVGAVMGAVSLLAPSAAQARLRSLVLGHPHAGAPSQHRWAQWVAALTRPISKLSAPAEGKHIEQSAKFIDYFMKAENLAAVGQGDWLIPTTQAALEAIPKATGG